MLAGLLPEDELCLLLARGEITPDVQARALELLAGPIRWDALWQRAEEHQVLPLIYRSLRSLEFQGVPPDVQSRLKADFRHNAVRSMLFAAELGRLLRVLGEAGIRVLPLKGIALAELLYGDAAMRFSSDIDILVSLGDALRARRLILAAGYTSPFTEEFFAKHQFHSSADCPLQAERGGGGYFLELHWTFLQHSSRDAEAMEDLWSQARPRDFFGVQAYSLSPEWQFLYLAGHAASHKWQTLKWIADIHDLCAAEPINWQAVRAKATRFDLELIVGATLEVCSRLYGMSAPAEFPSVALPTGVPLFPHSMDSPQAWNAPLFYPKLLKRPTEKLRWFAEMFFVARLADRMFFRLPPSLDFLYFLLRPLRLTAKWVRLFLSAGYGRMQKWLRIPSK